MTVLLVAAAATLAVLVALFSAGVPLVKNESTYWGARLLPPGPGANGLPLIPVRVNEAGLLEGVPTHLPWYNYCNPGAPGLSPDFGGSNVFTYNVVPERVQAADSQGIETWYEELHDQAARPSHFTEDWQGAQVVWRSPSDSRVEQLRAILLRVDTSQYPENLRNEFMPDGFAAFNAGDTHFCCVVGYRENNSPRAKADDGFDYIFDSCHDDRFDVRQIRKYDMPPGGEYGAG